MLSRHVLRSTRLASTHATDGPVDDALVPFGLEREIAAIVGGFPAALGRNLASHPINPIPIYAMTTHKPFSMIREFHLADWFTLANAVCGIGALFSVVTYIQTSEATNIYIACGLVFAALIFDVLDGRIARWRQKSSMMGRELDSLADIISFGVAPAMIGYGCGMQGAYDRVVLAYFVACGVSRLARYNVTADALSAGSDKVKYFEGTPIPTSILIVALLALAAWMGAVRENLWFGEVRLAGLTLHPFVFVFALSGSLMISRLRIPKP